MINSRLGRFAAAPARSGRVVLHPQGRSFSRSYGASMPSSLTMVLPIASVCSTRPPVSVLVRAPMVLPRGFSRKHGLAGFAMRLRLASQASVRRWFPRASPYMLSRGRPEPRSAALLRRLFGITSHQRHGNIYPLCIGYAFPPRLSSRLTLGGLAFPRKPWACGGWVSRPALATHASILAPHRSTEARAIRFAPMRRLPYH